MKAEGHTSQLTSTRARRRARGLAGLAAFLLALGVLSVSAPARASDGSWLQRINDFRTANGVGTLQIDGPLDSLSQQRSDANSQSGRLEHSPSLSAGLSSNWLKLGENVGVGSSEDQIWNAFLNSPQHRANLLDGAFTHVGIGETNNGRMWITHRFMRMGSGGGPSPAPAPAPLPAPAPAPAPAVVVQPAPAAPVVVQQQPATRTQSAPKSSGNGNASTNKPANTNGGGAAANGATDTAGAAETGTDNGAPAEAAPSETAPVVSGTPDAAAVVDALRVLQQ